MKNAITAYGKMMLRIAVLTVVALFGLGGCAWGSKKTVTAVETMTLTLRGMRGGRVYTFANENGNTELRLYREVTAGKETVLELENSVPCDTQAIMEWMNACGVMRWDGFHGKHPKNVNDGVMFRFEARVNDGQTIIADGSANFPKGYHEFVRALDAVFAADDQAGV